MNLPSLAVFLYTLYYNIFLKAVNIPGRPSCAGDIKNAFSSDANKKSRSRNFRIFGGDYWNRTSDLMHVKHTL